MDLHTAIFNILTYELFTYKEGNVFRDYKLFGDGKSRMV